MIRALLFVVATLMAMLMAVAAGATDDELTIVITGSRVSLEEPATISLPNDITVTGLVEEDGQSYRSQKRSEIKLIPSADEVRITRLKKARGIFGQVCLLGGDSSSTEVLKDVSTIRLGPGEVAEITWRIPEKPEPTVQRSERHRDNRRQQPEEQPAVVIPEGISFRVHWVGGVGWMRPDQPWGWEPCPRSSVENIYLLTFHWEHQGWVLFHPPVAGVRKPSLGGNSRAGDIDPLKELFPTFLDQRGQLQLIVGTKRNPELWPEGYGPQIATEYLPDAVAMEAVVSYRSGEWLWKWEG